MLSSTPEACRAVHGCGPLESIAQAAANLLRSNLDPTLIVARPLNGGAPGGGTDEEAECWTITVGLEGTFCRRAANVPNLYELRNISFRGVISPTPVTVRGIEAAGGGEQAQADQSRRHGEQGEAHDQEGGEAAGEKGAPPPGGGRRNHLWRLALYRGRRQPHLPGRRGAGVAHRLRERGQPLPGSGRRAGKGDGRPDSHGGLLIALCLSALGLILAGGGLFFWLYASDLGVEATTTMGAARHFAGLGLRVALVWGPVLALSALVLAMGVERRRGERMAARDTD